MTCKIVIINPGIFRPGDAITGKIICIFEREERIRGIKCQFRGREKVHWNERRGKHTTHYHGQTDFVVANTDFMDEGTMRPGKYEYNFSYVLPPSDIPSSYQHQFGSITYFLHAYVDRPFAFDYKDDVALHVVSPIINHPTHQMRAVSLEVNKEVGTCCWPKEPSTMELRLERDNYVLGDVIYFKAIIRNTSDSEINSIAVQLSTTVQLTAYSPSTRHKTERILLAVAEGSGVAPGSTKIHKFSLKIPETAVITNFTRCTLFKQWCSLRVQALYPLFHSNMVAEVTIKLGDTIVRTEQIEHAVNSPSNSFVPVAEAPPVVYPPVPPSAPLANDRLAFIDDNNGTAEGPPPSYDDVVKGSY
uniref:Arrestin domain-containing protein 3-like n=1 Tax=Diabrotica virgifera virgifera TaxID=50390 RepID=A0A6P7F2G8_DIAVI